MSYIRRVWTNNETPVNQENMNHLEAGVEAISQQVDANTSRIDALEQRGHYLSGWNAVEGIPTTEPPQGLPYTYVPGDFFIVAEIAETQEDNYKPSGLAYTGQRSTTRETSAISVNDTYYFDGAVWSLIHSAIEIPEYTSDGTVTIDDRELGVVAINTQIAGGVASKQLKVWTGTATQFSGITTKDNDTLYLVTED